MLNASFLFFIRNMHDWYSETKQKKNISRSMYFEKKKNQVYELHTVAC